MFFACRYHQTSFAALKKRQTSFVGRIQGQQHYKRTPHRGYHQELKTLNTDD